MGIRSRTAGRPQQTFPGCFHYDESRERPGAILHLYRLFPHGTACGHVHEALRLQKRNHPRPATFCNGRICFYTCRFPAFGNPFSGGIVRHRLRVMHSRDGGKSLFDHPRPCGVGCTAVEPLAVVQRVGMDIRPAGRWRPDIRRCTG